MRVCGTENYSADEWELVPQEVPWQEAVQAWIEGKTITGVYKKSKHVYRSNGIYARFEDNEDMPLNKIELTHGKWYIN